MSIVLHLDLPAWRTHLAHIRGTTPGLVPVAKGNGYGFGLERLAAETLILRSQQPREDIPGLPSTQPLDTLAVGTTAEVARVRAGGWEGDVVVLAPWSHHDPLARELLDDPTVIATVSRTDDLAMIAQQRPGTRVLVEVLTSMKRHGVEPDDLARVRALSGQVDVVGWTIHLPMRAADPLGEARALAQACLAEVEAPVWVSHLAPDDVATLAAELPVAVRVRLGTRLWLGAPQTRRLTARVLDLHPVARGERIGYWQHRVPRDGWVVVVSGGTAHGVALSAPSSGATLRQRLVTAASGAMDAAGLALSPYTLDGRKRFFVEPPHMQSSLVFLPGAATVAIGDEVEVELRLTTAIVDQVIDSFR